ncbi:MAG: PilN domain-containing protein [Candidatus Omnitrophota bacterium]|nr:PilN domain-containing protein [Candidatus Omnitrophota bacterium]
MKDKNKKTIFIIQLSEAGLKIVKCLRHNAQAEFLSLSLEKIASEKELSGVLNKQGFKSNEIIVALPSNQATCRFLKIPSQNPEEIEKISGLQAARYLPFPTEELVTAYQVIRAGQDNFSDIILTIAHKNAVSSYLNILADNPKCAKLSIILSSYGICNLYYHLRKETETIMLIDAEGEQAELVIAEDKKMLFSRSVKLNLGQAGWEKALAAEITKTVDTFLKEAQGKRIKKIIILGIKDISSDSLLKIGQEADATTEFLNYPEELKLKLGHSFTSLIGLGLESLPESLNILPQKTKTRNLSLKLKNQQIKLGILIAGIIIAGFLGIAKNMDNKTIYLQRLKKQLSGVEKEARPLEGMEKRFKLIENNAGRTDSALDILYELHRIVPEHISLINFNYEENRLVLLHGSTSDLNSVFALVAALEKSPAFTKYNIKIKYATRKKIQTGEIIDFEIGCTR